jgi:hypothetical protein
MKDSKKEGMTQRRKERETGNRDMYTYLEKEKKNQENDI